MKDTPCDICDFELWLPIATLNVSTLSLYSDSRFPGRSILKLNRHVDALEDMEDSLLSQYMSDVKTAVNALKTVTGSKRINFSILGNTVSHVHAHLIPRYSELETFPGKSPWNDPRKLTSLSEEEEKDLIARILVELNI